MRKDLRKETLFQESRELGFELTFQIADEQGEDGIKRVFAEFMREAIEFNDLSFGGAGKGGIWLGVVYSSAQPGTGTTEKQRDVVLRWLRRHPSISGVSVHPVFDLWYDDEVPQRASLSAEQTSAPSARNVADY